MKIKKRIRKTLSVFLALCLTLSGIGIMTGNVHADDNVFTGIIKVGGSDISCTYTRTGDETVQIGDGHNPAISTDATGALEIPGTVKDINNGRTYAVTKLGDNCFNNCRLLTDTGLANNHTITDLGNFCFMKCRSLTDTGLESNSMLTTLPIECFSNCVSLTDTGLAKNHVVTKLNPNCYSGCTSLVHAAVGSNVTVIGINSFGEDTALKDVCFYGNIPPSGSIDWICKSGATPSITVYYLSENNGWAGKSTTDVARSGDSLKSLSKIDVIGGSGAASLNYWASEKGNGEGSKTIDRYAQGDIVALTPDYATKLDHWKSNDATGSFSDDASTYTVGTSAGQDTSAIRSIYSLCTVKFDTKGGSSVSDKTASCGTKLSEPSQPVKPGYTFNGWYADNTFTRVWDFTSDLITKDTTLYAKWKLVPIIPIVPIEQIITSSSFTRPYNSGVFDISATTSGNGILDYSSDNSSVAAVSSSGTATIKGYGTANIMINASATASYKAASRIVTITVVPPKAKIKSVSVKKHRGKYRSIKVKWTKDKTVTGYQIYMSKYSNFKKAKKSILIKKKMTGTTTFNKLNKKHKYYVKVREYVKVGGVNYYGDWSSIKSVKTR